ncbi:uncharacterized protein CCR75_005712 [Bremia lactucae]|uniref:Endonuclease/exonuclease/phosphatase domain-containing protein n=1 Tax=Bremia lactucae TaxID=4779 RepID=A0A976IIL8_BRELC|nr:hypothetical protein CCR75_005712 [Bremia lactucae]
MERDGSAVRLCLWTYTASYSTSRLWDVMASWGVDLSALLKIQRVRAMGRSWRYDIWVGTSAWPSLLAVLSLRIPAGWRVFRSRRWKERSRKRGRRVPSPRTLSISPNAGTTKFKFATLNVCGVRHKRQELDQLLFRERIGVLCIQETLLLDDGWQLRLAGYTSHSLGMGIGKGRRGLTTLVHKSIPSYVLSRSKSGQHLWVRIFPSWAPNGVVVGNIYCGHTPRKEAVLSSMLRTFRRYSGQWPTIMLGDFNQDKQRVLRASMTLGVSLLNPPSQTKKTFYIREKAMSTLDYGFYNSSLASLGECKHTVLQDYRLSDHLPYLLSLSTGTSLPCNPVSVESQVRCNGNGWWRDADEIALHNYWDPLVDLMDDLEAPVDVQYQHLVSTTRRVCDEVDRTFEVPVVPRPERFKQTYTLSPRVRSNYSCARKWWRRCCLARSPVAAQKAYMQYATLQKEARRGVRECGKVSWLAHVHLMSRNLVEHDSKKWWRLARSMTEDQSQLCPVRNDADSLVIGGSAEAEAWHQHFKRLLHTDSDWVPRCELPILGVLPGISDRITWPELKSCLETTQSGKMPGSSGIPTEIFKACASPLKWGEPAPLEPPNAMACCLLGMVNSVYLRGTIPRDMTEKWIVAIPKKGDLTDRDNYRGIVLMDSILKLIMRIIAVRTSKSLESSGQNKGDFDLAGNA